jgi:delta 1-pyrroline-5-carboxylate dehydrogenase
LPRACSRFLAGATAELVLGRPGAPGDRRGPGDRRRSARHARGARRTHGSRGAPRVQGAGARGAGRELLRTARLRDRVLEAVDREVFGPILHVVRFEGATSARCSSA